MYNERIKHIDMRHHFVQDIVADTLVIVKRIRTAQNLIDMSTKPSPTIKFKHCFDLVGFIHHKPYLMTREHFLIHYILLKHLSQGGDL